MSRRIITEKLDASDTRPKDDWFDKVTKSIAADVVAGWVGITTLLGAKASNTTLLWVLFVIFIPITAAWTWRQTQEGDKPVDQGADCDFHPGICRLGLCVWRTVQLSVLLPT